jgi:hypothetical protein
MRRPSVAVGFVLQMFEDFFDDPRLGNERDDAQRSPVRTQKWVELENSSDETRLPVDLPLARQR